MQRPLGIHILSQLNECDYDALLTRAASELEKLVLSVIGASGLTVVGSLFNQFDGGGVTGLALLAESHVAIHTWPELAYATVEVYVCNYERNNAASAEQVHSELITLFNPGSVVTHRISR